jgi:hypothetical protein
MTLDASDRASPRTLALIAAAECAFGKRSVAIQHPSVLQAVVPSSRRVSSDRFAVGSGHRRCGPRRPGFDGHQPKGVRHDQHPSHQQVRDHAAPTARRRGRRRGVRRARPRISRTRTGRPAGRRNHLRSQLQPSHRWADRRAVLGSSHLVEPAERTEPRPKLGRWLISRPNLRRANRLADGQAGGSSRTNGICRLV